LFFLIESLNYELVQTFTPTIVIKSFSFGKFILDYFLIKARCNVMVMKEKCTILKQYLVSITIFLLLLILSVNSLVAQTKKLAEIAVYSGNTTYVDVPVEASMERVLLQQQNGVLNLYEITGGIEKPVASQLKTGNPVMLTWILKGKTLPGAVRNFELRAEQEAPAFDSETVKFNVKDDGENLLIKIDEKPVVNYRYALMEAPEGVDEIYSRSGYIHPIWSPEGEILSRIQPPDHYHHYGIWNPWTLTEFEGREVDFWNLAKGEGTVRAKHLTERNEGSVFAGFKAIHDHIDFTGPDGEKTALTEQWNVNVWNVDPEQKVWLIDFTSVLNPAAESPLTIKAYRYQGFSLRATEKWNDNNTELLTSEGLNKSSANATRAKWIDVNGISEAEAGTSGILFMTHQGNYNYPETLRIWPVGSNEGTENVYINFNPAQDRDWKLVPGNSYVLNYRMLVYDGKIDAEEADRYWENFSNPPRVEVYPSGAIEGANVLVYTKNGEGYVHENIPYSVDAIKKLGEKYGFTVDESDDPAVFTDENLKQYDALIFSNTNNETFHTDGQRQALKTYIRNGGGFVGIHSTSGSERDWPWFSKLVGGNFERHAPRQDFYVDIVDRAHPSSSFLPDRWLIKDDESYYLKELNPGIKVVLAVDLTTVEDDERSVYPGKMFGDSFPVAWYQEFDGGRQWYTTLGHRAEQYSDPIFMRHILGGIQWTINGISH